MYQCIMSKHQKLQERAIAKVISEFPCKRCDPEKTGQPCQHHGKECWSLYEQEAKKIHSTFVAPVQRTNRNLRVMGIVLSCLVMCSLMIPIKIGNHHHVLDRLLGEAVQIVNKDLADINEVFIKLILKKEEEDRKNNYLYMH